MELNGPMSLCGPSCRKGGGGPTQSFTAPERCHLRTKRDLLYPVLEFAQAHRSSTTMNPLAKGGPSPFLVITCSGGAPARWCYWQLVTVGTGQCCWCPCEADAKWGQAWGSAEEWDAQNDEDQAYSRAWARREKSSSASPAFSRKQVD